MCKSWRCCIISFFFPGIQASVHEWFQTCGNWRGLLQPQCQNYRGEEEERWEKKPLGVRMKNNMADFVRLCDWQDQNCPFFLLYLLWKLWLNKQIPNITLFERTVINLGYDTLLLWFFHCQASSITFNRCKPISGLKTPGPYGDQRPEVPICSESLIFSWIPFGLTYCSRMWLFNKVIG